MPGEYMTLEDAAKFLNMSAEAVRLLMDKGFARRDKDGRLLVKTAEIRDWLHRGIKDLDIGQLHKLEKDYAEKALQIHTLLDPGCIRRQLIGRSKVAIIDELIELLIENGDVDPKYRKKIRMAVIERERMCSTAIADGVAIPHPREPLTGIIKKPRLVLGLSWHGVDFESLDGKPTHAVVLLCTPRLDMHLQLLARLTRLLRSTKFRVAMCNAKDAKEIIETFAAFEKGAA